MNSHEAVENHVAAVAETDSAVHVPSLQLTEGQPPPIAANGGLSCMSFGRDGDRGTTAAIEAALDQIAEGYVQAFFDRIESAPSGPIETQWGLLEFFPDATDALVYNHDVFDKDYQGDRTEDQDAKNPGVNASYVNLVHNDLNDNSGRGRDPTAPVDAPWRKNVVVRSRYRMS